ncbi:survival motor neuron protein [Musca vetustissima]|uniref:survival motor neuron protein n=1 Tax=Musca vetustissima TaxID=27455 RepID=UPI002AB71B52|nr:survival motor neuron protein [Musca vetustissima]
MSAAKVPNESKDATAAADDVWDDTLLIKAYDDSVKLAREELARRISLSTSKKSDTNDTSEGKKSKSSGSGAGTAAGGTLENIASHAEYKVGDYVRATYEDGIDYEAKIMSIDKEAGTCLLKYIGYDNVQEVALCDLIASWGKKYRRLQFAKAKLEAETTAPDDAVNVTCPSTSGKTAKKIKTKLSKSTMPPPPPIPPMLTASHNAEDSEHLSAMLMSWYMSGYYTGVYQGMQMAKSKTKK